MYCFLAVIMLSIHVFLGINALISFPWLISSVTVPFLAMWCNLSQ